MATAVLLCTTILTLAVLAGIGWLVHDLHPHRTRIQIRIPLLGRMKVDLVGAPVTAPTPDHIEKSATAAAAHKRINEMILWRP